MTDIMKLRSHELSTKRALQEYLDLEDDTPEMWVAMRLLKAATDFIEGQLVTSDVMEGGYCHRRFLATTYTLALYTGNGFKNLFMRQYPINSITTIIINDTTEYPSGSDTLADLGFYIDYEVLGNIINTNIWSEGDPQNIQITYNAGFTEIPFDLEVAALGMVALKWQKIGKENIKSEKIGSYSYTLADVDQKNPFGDETIRQTLEKYKIPSL